VPDVQRAGQRLQFVGADFRFGAEEKQAAILIDAAFTVY
jgi:hypothetical protein